MKFTGAISMMMYWMSGHWGNWSWLPLAICSSDISLQLLCMLKLSSCACPLAMHVGCDSNWITSFSKVTAFCVQQLNCSYNVQNKSPLLYIYMCVYICVYVCVHVCTCVHQVSIAVNKNHNYKQLEWPCGGLRQCIQVHYLMMCYNFQDQHYKQLLTLR